MSSFGLSPTQHLIAFLNCKLWVLYGPPFVHPDNLFLIISNGIGCLISLVYLLLFAIYSKSLNYRRNVISYMILEVIFVGVVATVLNLAHDIKLCSQMVGVLAMISHLGLYATELPSMMLVIKTKSIEHLNPARWNAYFMGCFMWCAYALQPWNLYLFVPNVVLAIVAFAQLTLVELYHVAKLDVKLHDLDSTPDLFLV